MIERNFETEYDRRPRQSSNSSLRRKSAQMAHEPQDHEEEHDKDISPVPLQSLHFGASSVYEDETQINMILKGLRNKLNDLENLTLQKENEKAGIIEDINVLTQRLNALAKSIEKKRILYENYDKILKDSESAFVKITESTKTLLGVVKRENTALSKLTLTAKK